MKKFRSIYNAKFEVARFVKNNAIFLGVCAIFCFVAFLTGIFTALKLFKVDDNKLLETLDFVLKIEDFANISSNYFGRMFSYLVVVTILFISSLSVFLLPFGFAVLVYRAFLISINLMVVILIGTLGLSIKTLLIIVPCQILMLTILIFLFAFLNKQRVERKITKHKNAKTTFKGILIAVVALCLINLVETLLLIITRADVVLVI